MRRTIRWLTWLPAALALAVFAGGCAPKQPIVNKAIPTRNKADVLAVLNGQANLTRTLKAKLDVKMQSKEMKGPVTCEGYLAAQFPDRLRITGSHALLGYAPFDIGSDGATWFIHAHYDKLDQMHIGPAALLDELYDPDVPLRPRDIVIALGVGMLDEAPPQRELIFTKHPGYYEISEVVTNRSGRYQSMRLFVDPQMMVIMRMETFRPDGRIEMVAEMTYDAADTRSPSVPTGATIRLLRPDAFVMEMKLKDRKAGVALPAKVFNIPPTEGMPEVIRHEGR